MQSECAGIFSGKKDRFGGITINTSNFADRYTVQQFEKVLKDSIAEWTGNGIRGVWFRLPLNHAEYIPLLVQHGFEYHHAKTSYLMMIRWLPENAPNLLPPYPHTYIGVAGLVINDKEEILVIKEKFYMKSHWKFPGGYANPGEDFADTARREVQEETGIVTEFVSIVGQRHRHDHQFGCSDLYIVCHMKPITHEIKICKHEISECKWMSLEEYVADPKTINLNRIMIQSYFKSKERQVIVGATEIEPPFTTSGNAKLQNVYHLK